MSARVGQYLRLISEQRRADPTSAFYDRLGDQLDDLWFAMTNEERDDTRRLCQAARAARSGGGRED